MSARCRRWRCRCCARSRSNSSRAPPIISSCARGPTWRSTCSTRSAPICARWKSASPSPSRSPPMKSVRAPQAFIIDRGEQVHTAEAAKAIAERPQALAAPLEEEDDLEDFAAPEGEEVEAAGGRSRGRAGDARRAPPSRAKAVRGGGAGGGVAAVATAAKARTSSARGALRAASRMSPHDHVGAGEAHDQRRRQPITRRRPMTSWRAAG